MRITVWTMEDYYIWVREQEGLSKEGIPTPLYVQ
jgi:hypothetical protein